MLALVFLAQPAHAICLPCYLPEPPKPCAMHLNGKPGNAHAEHIRCMVADNGSMQFYVRQVEIALARCQQK